MFSKQKGYKRLCFRTKQNGPMCFVEFEDVSFATKALHELYGHPLHNSIKRRDSIRAFPRSSWRTFPAKLQQLQVQWLAHSVLQVDLRLPGSQLQRLQNLAHSLLRVNLRLAFYSASRTCTERNEFLGWLEWACLHRFYGRWWSYIGTGANKDFPSYMFGS